nr:immunoglobulin heavy chain junction region [Macaca mulatta]MOV48849.1 immunoglobulin heavy chain junction region [Macaca mulatta]MOV48965.1 immunoglobulin heavy chain junction region [Macaca mulatta]MOV49305.1 immunoglobulin heavy chain junction region [Macaca mulatta]MOV49321.1 immunoglobulin heavy chain junction region [Macaca mulatta]
CARGNYYGSGLGYW